MAGADLRSPSSRRCLGPVGRRDILQAGTLGALGLGLEGLWSAAARGDTTRANASERGPGFGSAKRCILLFQWGGPSHIDTLDPKPFAPLEVRVNSARSTPTYPAFAFPSCCRKPRHGWTD